MTNAQRRPSTMQDLPPFAAWRLQDAHAGFEVVFMSRRDDGYVFDGHSVGVEEGEPWSVGYTLELDAGWATRAAHVLARSTTGTSRVRLEGDGTGEWSIDGTPAPHLSACVDVDLEGSALTNAFPLRRLGLGVNEAANAPAAYVRAFDLRVERLEQTYTRLEDDGDRSRYDYAAPAFAYRGELVYDESGLVLDYPGIALRVA